jgi:hypothetical protein
MFACAYLLAGRSVADTRTLTADAPAIRVLRQRVPVLAFVNNHFAGSAPEMARQLLALADADASA